MTPIATAMVIGLSIAVEVMMRLNFVYAPMLENTTSAVNWSIATLMLILSILVRKYYYACIVVGPLLTAYIFYYFCIVDFAGRIDLLYNILLVGITITYLLLSLYMESWLPHAIISVPIFTLLIWR
jgi:hypothetical protein